MRNVCLLSKTFATGKPTKTYGFLPPISNYHRYVNSFNIVSCISECFKNYFIPYVTNEWNERDPGTLDPEVLQISELVSLGLLKGGH